MGSSSVRKSGYGRIYESEDLMGECSVIHFHLEFGEGGICNCMEFAQTWIAFPS